MSRKSRERNLKRLVANVMKDIDYEKDITEIKAEQKRLKQAEEDAKPIPTQELFDLPIVFLNDWNTCYLCKKPRNGLQLIKHHITYFPQKCCFVHDTCHDKIHDYKNPMWELIEYNEGDSIKFYQMMEKRKTN